jgi:hypothetical protein
MTAPRPRRAPAATETLSIQTKRSVPPDRFQLLVHCRDETEQRRLYHMLIAKGLMCRVLVS